MTRDAVQTLRSAVLATSLVVAAGAASASNYSFLDEAPVKHFTDADMQIKTYQAQGTTCRRLQIANKAGGLKSNVAFNFCKQADDSWQLIN